jgi:tetratricopeptide (TPR) repeat protein
MARTADSIPIDTPDDPDDGHRGPGSDLADSATAGVVLRRELDDEHDRSITLATLASIERDRGDLESAQTMLEEALATHRRTSDRQREATIAHDLGLVFVEKRQLDRARDAIELALSLARELGDRVETANALADLGLVAGLSGDRIAARTLYEEALQFATRIGPPGLVALVLEGLGALDAADGETRRAAMLWGAAAELRRRSSHALVLADRRRLEVAIEHARTQLDPASFDAAWEAGTRLDPAAAVELARAADEARPGRFG